MRQPLDYAGAYPSPWDGYVFKENLGYTSGKHTGVDYNGPGAGNADLGQPVYAICSGTVVGRKNSGEIAGFGNAIIIETQGAPVAGNKLYHRYLHLNTVNVSVGQKVSMGQVVATCGNTGTQWAHLHLDTWTDRNGMGAHWNYDKDTQLSSYEDPFYLIANNPNWDEQGGSVMNDDTSRQVGYHYLGRHGYDGRPNALASTQADLINQPLTNQKLSEVFLSTESRNWRDKQLPELFAERDRLRTENTNLKNEVTTLKANNANLVKANTQLTSDNATLTAENTKLTEANSQLTTENSELKVTVATQQKTIDEQAKRIAELEASSGGDVTINFNFIGVILWAIVKTFGLKK